MFRVVFLSLQCSAPLHHLTLLHPEHQIRAHGHRARPQTTPNHHPSAGVDFTFLIIYRRFDCSSSSDTSSRRAQKHTACLLTDGDPDPSSTLTHYQTCTRPRRRNPTGDGTDVRSESMICDLMLKREQELRRKDEQHQMSSVITTL